MSKKATRWEESFLLPNQGLRAYFARVERGQPDEYRTTFYTGKSVQSVLSDWEKILSAIQQKYPELWEYEIDLQKKVGPMSIMQPLSNRLKDIDSYYDSIHLESTAIDDRAIAATIREFQAVSGLRIRSVERTVESMKKSTNSGSPYFTKRSAVVSRTVPCSSRLVGSQVAPLCETVQGTPPSYWLTPAILGWRGQEGGPEREDTKQRVVWMFPFAVNIQELQAYQPLIESIQQKRLVPAWVSMDEVDKVVTQLFDSKGDKDPVICTDFTAFDQHFNADMQRVSLDILTSLFTKDVSSSLWFTNVFPIKYGIPLAVRWNEIRTGLHGMASGSGGTNADETLAHRALQHEAAILHNQVLNPNSQCLGDDGVMSYPGCTVEDVIKSYTSHGLEMNPEKQYVSDHDCIYLRRWHASYYRVRGICVGVYSTFRALGRLMEQERYYDPEVWGPKMIALRQLSILENVKYHPLKEQFVQFCMKGDKFRLGLDIPGFLDNIATFAQEAIDVVPDFMGYVRSLDSKGDVVSGIASWWIVNYLKSIS